MVADEKRNVESLARVERLLGAEAMHRLRASYVVILGYGAVGSMAAEALCRSGVGHLRVIDADRVEASNINRQLCAYHSSLGRAKVDVARERLRDINPEAQIECEHVFISRSNLEILFSPRLPDLVVDAIDSVDAKVAVLQACIVRGVEVISSMGAARRLDPLKVRVGDISQTSHCALARVVRQSLRKLGIERGVRCVYSLEDGVQMALEEGESAKGALGSMMSVTGCFGLVCASEGVQVLLRGVAGPGAPQRG